MYGDSNVRVNITRQDNRLLKVSLIFAVGNKRETHHEKPKSRDVGFS